MKKILNKLLKEWPGGKLKMQVIAAGGKITEVEWSASVLQNNLKNDNRNYFITKKITIP